MLLCCALTWVCYLIHGQVCCSESINGIPDKPEGMAQLLASLENEWGPDDGHGNALNDYHCLLVSSHLKPSTAIVLYMLHLAGLGGAYFYCIK